MIGVIKYAVAWGCGIIFVIGLLAASFEDNVFVRLIALVFSVLAVILGNHILKEKKITV